VTRYAEGTSVTIQSSQAELQLLLVRRGADQVVNGWDQTEGAAVTFRIRGRYVKLTIPKPDIRILVERYPRTEESELEAREERRMWRALILLVKAKLEAIDAGISSFDREFLADLLLPNGETLMSAAAPAIEAAYKNGTMPALLPAFAGKSR
jgi:hypothetical protein